MDDTLDATMEVEMEVEEAPAQQEEDKDKDKDNNSDSDSDPLLVALQAILQVKLIFNLPKSERV
jgi:hypothetical protein